MKATFDDETFKYTIDGQDVTNLEAKGASAAIARQSKANIQILSQRLQSNQITLQEWYDGLQRETKLLHMGEFALANGGIDQVADWGRAEEIIRDTWNGNDDFKGLRSFGEDIQNGRYGTTELGRGFLARSLQYADAGRATYENERLAAQMLRYPMEAKRVMGGTEHCNDCPRWAALGWMPANEMYEKYAIGMAQCNINDYCVIVTRRTAIDDEQKVGWKALLPSLQTASRVAANTGLIVGALAIFRYASNNPTLMNIALGLVLKALGATKV